MSDLAVEVSGLRKSYGPHEAVKGIDLSVARSEVFGFLGTNAKVHELRRLDAPRYSIARGVHDDGMNQLTAWRRLRAWDGGDVTPTGATAAKKIGRCATPIGSTTGDMRRSVPGPGARTPPDRRGGAQGATPRLPRVAT